MTDIKRRTLLGWFGGLGLVPLWRSISSLPFLAKGTEGIAEDGASQNTAYAGAIPAEAATQTGLPVEIEGVSISSDSVTRSTMLTYSVRNMGESPTTYVMLRALFFDKNGGVRGALRWMDKSPILSDETRTSTYQYGGTLYINPKGPYTRVVLAAVAGATEDGAAWQLTTSLNNLLTATRKGSSVEGAVVSVTPLTDCCSESYWTNCCINDGTQLCGNHPCTCDACNCSVCCCNITCCQGPPPPPIG